jgi:hypothetical protein
MKSALAAAALALAACGGRSNVTVQPGQVVDPMRFRRLAVVPFADTHGDGLLMAAKVSTGLGRLDYNCADLHQIEAVFSSLKLDYAGGLSLETLAEIRHATLADALLFGSVDSRWREANVLLVETETGDVVLSAKVKPRGSVFSSNDEIAEAVVGVFAGGPRRSKPKAAEIPALPDSL